MEFIIRYNRQWWHFEEVDDLRVQFHPGDPPYLEMPHGGRIAGRPLDDDTVLGGAEAVSFSNHRRYMAIPAGRTSNRKAGGTA